MLKTIFQYQLRKDRLTWQSYNEVLPLNKNSLYCSCWLDWEIAVKLFVLMTFTWYINLWLIYSVHHLNGVTWKRFHNVSSSMNLEKYNGSRNWQKIYCVTHMLHINLIYWSIWFVPINMKIPNLLAVDFPRWIFCNFLAQVLPLNERSELRCSILICT